MKVENEPVVRMKTKREKKIELARIKTYFKQAIFNPVKTLLLDWQFMVRVVGFGAFLYGISQFTEQRQNEGAELFKKV